MSKRLGYVRDDGDGGMSPELIQYLETALWAEVDDEGDPLDDNWGVDDFSEIAVFRAKRDLQQFIDLVVALGDFDRTDLAHSFWLTRNRHGSGFFDSPKKWGGKETADALTEVAHGFGETSVYVSDSDQLEFE